jgi:hypothetical protein
MLSVILSKEAWIVEHRREKRFVFNLKTRNDGGCFGSITMIVINEHHSARTELNRLNQIGDPNSFGIPRNAWEDKVLKDFSFFEQL